MISSHEVSDSRVLLDGPEEFGCPKHEDTIDLFSFNRVREIVLKFCSQVDRNFYRPVDVRKGRFILISRRKRPIVQGDQE